jgi:hypothetical protein
MSHTSVRGLRKLKSRARRVKVQKKYRKKVSNMKTNKKHTWPQKWPIAAFIGGLALMACLAFTGAISMVADTGQGGTEITFAPTDQGVLSPTPLAENIAGLNNIAVSPSDNLAAFRTNAGTLNQVIVPPANTENWTAGLKNNANEPPGAAQVANYTANGNENVSPPAQAAMNSSPHNVNDAIAVATLTQAVTGNNQAPLAPAPVAEFTG